MENDRHVNGRTSPPVLVTAFRRPSLTVKVLGAVHAANPSIVYFAVDGPRSNDGESEAVAEVRGTVDEFDWDCPVVRIFHDTNLGAKDAVTHALDTFFESEQAGIILEDDCVPSPGFFVFAQEALAKYRTTPQVGMIAGTNFLRRTPRRGVDALFSEGHIWGWATWADRWNEYRSQERTYTHYQNAPDYYGLGWKYRNMLIQQAHSEQLDAWDIPWLLHLAEENTLCLVPTRNLVSNLGHSRETSTHTSGRSRFAGLKTYEFRNEIRLPDEIRKDAVYQGTYALSVRFEHALHTFRRPIVAWLRGLMDPKRGNNA